MHPLYLPSAIEYPLGDVAGGGDFALRQRHAVGAREHQPSRIVVGVVQAEQVADLVATDPLVVDGGLVRDEEHS